MEKCGKGDGSPKVGSSRSLIVSNDQKISRPRWPVLVLPEYRKVVVLEEKLVVSKGTFRRNTGTVIWGNRDGTHYRS